MKQYNPLVQDHPLDDRPSKRLPFSNADLDRGSDAINTVLHLLLLICLISALAIFGREMTGAVAGPAAQMAEATPAPSVPTPSAARVAL